MRRRWFWSIGTGMIGIIFLQQSANAATYYVPDDYSTIQEAVDASWGGDTVVVRAGVYTGEGNKNILIDKILTVKSESGPEDTIIDCEGDGRGFHFSNVTNETVLDGFQIINGYVTTHGVSTLTSRNSVLVTACRVPWMCTIRPVPIRA